MNIRDLIPEKQLNHALDEGYVRAAGHPKGRLRLYTYTHKAHRDFMWNQATVNCRGLITDAEGNIVSRGYEKTFDIGTQAFPELCPQNFPHDEPEILESLDGWIGIAYEAEGVRGIATKGSFTSEVANIASNIYNMKYPRSNWPSGYTPVFEIIHPLTRVVVPYDFNDLVLTGLVHIKTGHHLTWKEMTGYAEDNNMRVVEQVFGMPLDKLLAEVMAQDAQNREGFILKWHLGDAPPLMGRLKFGEYRQSTRIMQNFDARTVWTMMRNEQSLEGFYKSKFLTDGFRQKMSQVSMDLNTRFMEVEKLGWKLVDMYPAMTRESGAFKFDHKHLAKWLLRKCEELNQPRQLAMLVINMVNGKAYKDKIWDMIAPAPQPHEEI